MAKYIKLDDAMAAVHREIGANISVAQTYMLKRIAIGLKAKPTVTMTDAKRALADMFPADVEQVTRCKDCYQSVVIGDVLHCTYWSKDTDENGYCHEGG